MTKHRSQYQKMPQTSIKGNKRAGKVGPLGFRQKIKRWSCLKMESVPGKVIHEILLNVEIQTDH